MSNPNTLLVNGVDLRGVTDVHVVGDMSSILYAPGTLKGSNDDLPGARGVLGAALPLAAYSGTVQLQVTGTTREAKTATLRAFLQSIRSGLSPLVTLERRLSKVGGGYDAWTAHGQITGTGITIFNSQTGRAELQLVNLDGAWSPDAFATFVIP